jgi:hypothetical protein
VHIEEIDSGGHMIDLMFLIKAVGLIDLTLLGCALYYAILVLIRVYVRQSFRAIK